VHHDPKCSLDFYPNNVNPGIYIEAENPQVIFKGKLTQAH